MLLAALLGCAVTSPAAAQTADLWAVAGDAAGAVAVGSGGRVLFAGAGHATFLPAEIPAITADLRGCAYVEASLYYAVGDAGTILKSTGPTGAAFAAEASGVGADLYAVAALQSRVVAVGTGGTIVRSAALSGGGWTVVSAPVAATLRGVAGTGVASVAVGEEGVVPRGDPAGSTWAEVEDVPGTGAALHAVAALADGRFVAVGAAGTVLRALADGQTWTLMPAPAEVDLYGVAERPGAIQVIVVVGAGGAIYTSSDAGGSWQAALSGVARTLRGVVYTGADFLATGDHGTLLRSLDGTVWADQTPAEDSTWGAIKNLWR
jgi:photosystem II stability/assembly factor-like uncharacterized protein